MNPLRTADELRSTIPWLREEFGYGDLAVYHCAPNGDTLVLAAGGEDLTAATHQRSPVDSATVSGKAASTGESMIAGDVGREPKHGGGSQAMRDAGSETIPMRIGTEMVGASALGRNIDMQQFGIGLGRAVLIDATLIRSTLLAASMKLMGDLNWHLPKWLEWLPDVSVEGPEAETPPEVSPVTETAAVEAGD